MTTPVPRPVTVPGSGAMGSAADVLAGKAFADLSSGGVEQARAAADRGLGDALPEPFKSTVERASAAGHGSDSLAGVIEVLRRAEVAA